MTPVLNMESTGQRRLAAIMFTDMVGYSALTQRDEALAMGLLEEHFRLLRQIFPQFEGTEIKTIGDAFLVEFPSALQAANCAVAIQKALWERNQKLDDDRSRILLRIGLHVGDVIHTGGDVFGDGVNIAARIEPCAPAGGICLSEDMARPLRNKLEFPLVRTGEKKLKNIADPVNLYQIELPWLPSPEVDSDSAPPSSTTLRGRLKRKLSGSGPLRFAAMAALPLILLVIFGMMEFFSGSVSEAGVQRMALLPLSYAGPPEKATYSNMFPALLAESLRASPGLSVAPFESSRRFQPEEEATRVAGELNVDWILQGELTVRESSYDLSLRVNGRADTRWSRRLGGELEQLFSQAEDLTSEIEQHMRVKQAGASITSRDPAVMEAYLRGKSFLEGWDIQANFQKARASFAQAVELDPDFGEAYSGLARATWGIYEETADASRVQEALQAARKAVKLVPDHPEAHLALGVIQLGRGKSQEAVMSFEAALESAPADDAACRRIGEAYAGLKRDREAEAMFQRAIDLRPDFWQNYRAKGNFYFDRGRYEEAKQLFRKLVSLRPNSDVGHNNLGAVCLALGEMEEAETHFKRALEVQPTSANFSNLGMIYYSRANYQEAAEHFLQAAELGNEAGAWLNLGDAYRQLEQDEEARRAYEEAIRLSRGRLAVNATDAMLRAVLAYALAGAGRCRDAGEEAAKAGSQGMGQPLIHYYAGVAFAICGQDDQADGHIVRSIEGGLVAHVQTNPDLRRLLDRPGIKELISAERNSGLDGS